MARLSSDQIAALFLDRADRFGGVRLTVKQMNWIVGVWQQETRAAFGSSQTMTVPGSRWDIYTLVALPNGAGMLKPLPTPEWMDFYRQATTAGAA